MQTKALAIIATITTLLVLAATASAHHTGYHNCGCTSTGTTTIATTSTTTVNTTTTTTTIDPADPPSQNPSGYRLEGSTGGIADFYGEQAFCYQFNECSGNVSYWNPSTQSVWVFKTDGTNYNTGHGIVQDYVITRMG